MTTAEIFGKAFDVIGIVILAMIFLFLVAVVIPKLMRIEFIRLLVPFLWMKDWQRFRKFSFPWQRSRLVVFYGLLIGFIYWQIAIIEIMRFFGEVVPYVRKSYFLDFMFPYLWYEPFPIIGFIVGFVGTNFLCALYSAAFFRFDDIKTPVQNLRNELAILRNCLWEIKWLNPYAVLCRTNAFIDIDDLLKMRGKMQTKTDLWWLAISEVRPQHFLFVVSKNGLLNMNIDFSMLAPSKERSRICVGLSPLPVWIDWRLTPHIAAFGPTRMGKTGFLQTIAAKQAEADPDTLFIFVAMIGANFTAAEYDPRQLLSDQRPETMPLYQWAYRCRKLDNVVLVRDPDTFVKLVDLIKEEERQRDRIMEKHFVDHILELEDLNDPECKRLPRIMIFMDEVHEMRLVFRENKKVQRALDIVQSMLFSSGKFKIDWIFATPRGDFDTIGPARDGFGIFMFGAKANELFMAFKTPDAKSMMRLPGFFMYELPPPMIGLSFGYTARSGQRLMSGYLAEGNKKASYFARMNFHRFRDALNADFNLEYLEMIDRKQRKFIEGKRKKELSQWIDKEDGGLVLEDRKEIASHRS